MTRFEGKVVLIAGAAGGIGATVARRFAEEGAELALFDIGPAVERLSGPTTSNALVGEVDLASEASCNAAVAATVERYRRIDALAIIAGVVQEATPIDELSSAEWDRVMTVNLKGPFLLSR
ncbi:MAG: SDR family NAD(P)-dependent oxidoreductase, partial [Acidimicrobiia bacterium]|nr:SDR family NAD(P)-dependent oxidoreductase [Acidimicrobiia bacterium]